MAAFSESEINEAKERVRRMKERASSYIDFQEKEENNRSHAREDGEGHRGEERDRRREQEEIHNRPDSECLDDETNSQGESDDQSFIILMLILLLSHEGADNALILALLYLLF